MQTTWEESIECNSELIFCVGQSTSAWCKEVLWSCCCIHCEVIDEISVNLSWEVVRIYKQKYSQINSQKDTTLFIIMCRDNPIGVYHCAAFFTPWRNILIEAEQRTSSNNKIYDHKIFHRSVKRTTRGAHFWVDEYRILMWSALWSHDIACWDDNRQHWIGEFLYIYMIDRRAGERTFPFSLADLI